MKSRDAAGVCCSLMVRRCSPGFFHARRRTAAVILSDARQGLLHCTAGLELGDADDVLVDEEQRRLDDMTNELVAQVAATEVDARLPPHLTVLQVHSPVAYRQRVVDE